MIGQPQPNPRDAIVNELNRHLDQFFSRGGSAQQVAQGVSGEKVGFGATAHHERLKAERARLAPEVRKHAENGLDPAQIGAAMSMRVQRVLMIATENNIVIRGRP